MQLTRILGFNSYISVAGLIFGYQLDPLLNSKHWIVVVVFHLYKCDQ